MKHLETPLDRRGYQGPEKNRQLDPKEVVWARNEFFAGRVTPKQLSRQFDMGIESVRRMLRGDTYANVGEALPRANDAQALTVDDGGALERLLHASPPAGQAAKADVLPPSFAELEDEPVDGEEAVLKFLRDELPPKG